MMRFDEGEYACGVEYELGGEYGCGGEYVCGGEMSTTARTIKSV
jgi:hypothetical protein